MPAVGEHIWALLTTADHNHSWQTLEGPAGTHLPKPPLLVLTAVKQGIHSPERINQTPGENQIDGETMETEKDFTFWVSKSL